MNNLYSVYHDVDLKERDRDFIVRWHYSKSYRSLKQKHIFRLIENETRRLVGIAVYGDPISIHYNEQNLIELRRLCLVDDTPRNSESFFIAKTLRFLSKHTEYDKVISFADPNVGHLGTIYKASNFKYEDNPKSYPSQVIKMGDKVIHKREMYAKKDGEYTNSALRIQEMVSNGEAEVLNQKNKIKYVYDLR